MRTDRLQSKRLITQDKRLILEAVRLKEIERLSQDRDKDSKEVAEFVKKYGIGSIDWQKAMITRIKSKVTHSERLTLIDQIFLAVQEEHVRFLKEYTRSMGADNIILN